MRCEHMCLLGRISDVCEGDCSPDLLYDDATRLGAAPAVTPVLCLAHARRHHRTRDIVI